MGMGGNKELLNGKKWEWDLSFRWEWEWSHWNGRELGQKINSRTPLTETSANGKRPWTMCRVDNPNTRHVTHSTLSNGLRPTQLELNRRQTDVFSDFFLQFRSFAHYHVTWPTWQFTVFRRAKANRCTRSVLTQARRDRCHKRQQRRKVIKHRMYNYRKHGTNEPTVTCGLSVLSYQGWTGEDRPETQQ